MEAPTEEELDQETLLAYAEEMQNFLRTNQKSFQTFSEDVSLEYKLSDRFMIDFEKGEVHMDASWFFRRGFTKEQIRWAIFHELSHFKDYVHDSEEANEVFRGVVSESAGTAKKIAKKLEEVFPEKQEEIQRMNKPDESGSSILGPMSQIESMAYRIHHTFHNTLDDIYVNHTVVRKAPLYEPIRSGGEAVKSLYKEILFPLADYTASQRHLQFCHKLLREQMIPDEKVIVSDEVQALLDREIEFAGKKYTAKLLIETFLKPRVARETSWKTREKIISSTLYPLFQELVDKDLEDWEPKESNKQKNGDKSENATGEPDEGEGENEDESENGESSGGSSGAGFPELPFQDEYDAFDENSIDQMSEKEIEAWARKTIEAQEEAEAEENKTAEERAQEAQDRLDKIWCEKNQFEFQQFKDYARIESEIAPYLEELSRLWEKIVHGKSLEESRQKEGYYKTGMDISIPEVVRQFPKLEQKRFGEVRVMERMIPKESIVHMPEVIRVRLVGDVSGSMDGQRRRVLMKVMALIASSLDEFNARMERRFGIGAKKRMRGESEIYLFSDRVHKVKDASYSHVNDERVQMRKAVLAAADAGGGGTNDSAALNQILQELTDEDKIKIEKNKLLDMVIEVTDGVPNNPSLTREAGDRLRDAGIIVKAFQIGTIGEGDSALFNNVWNAGEGERHGESIGTDISQLVPAITILLKSYLNNIT